MIYICPKCKQKERLQKKCIFYCDDCSIIMLEEKMLDIAGKIKCPISEADTLKVGITTAKAMKKRFGMMKWMLPYLVITKKEVEVTSELIEKFK